MIHTPEHHEKWMSSLGFTENITAGAVLGTLGCYRGKPVKVIDIAKWLYTDITNAENHRKLRDVIKDLRYHAQIADTPYGYVLMTESIMFGEQLGVHYYRLRDEPDISMIKDSKNYVTYLRYNKVDHIYAPSCEISHLPEGVIVLMRVHRLYEAHLIHEYHHEFMYRHDKDSPWIPCNNWYYMHENK